MPRFQGGNPASSVVSPSSSPPPCLVDFLSGQFLNLGIAVNDHARNLGIDFFLGPRRHSEVRAARRSAVELRASKLMSVKRACAHGAWKVGRCGLWPAFSYGYAITGMSVAERTFARRVVFGARLGSRQAAPRPLRLHLQALTLQSKSTRGQ